MEGGERGWGRGGFPQGLVGDFPAGFPIDVLWKSAVKIANGEHMLVAAATGHKCEPVAQIVTM